MLLSRLLAGQTDPPEVTGRDVALTGLTADSRAVTPGCLFAALPGAKADGRSFIADAVARGAAAVLAPRGTVLPSGTGAVTLVLDDEPRRAFALLAAAFHARQPGTVVAVTGTNGKTSTAQFTRQIWTALGHNAAALGTLGVTAPGVDRYVGMTTPDPVTLHRALAEMADAGIGHLAIEASSHGLDQHRLDGVRIAAAGFTNLSRDHLDYHGTMEAYLDAKAALFGRLLPPEGTAVLNADAPESATLAALCSSRRIAVLDYGAAATGITVRAIESLPHGQRLSLAVLGRAVTADLPLVGRFQAWNALCVLGLAIASGSDRDAALHALERLEGVPGRLQHAATHPNGAPVYVDFAHTPDALDTVLRALRPHAEGRLVCVFGCGGDRDRGKRPVMGALAARLADRAIVTDDNPRTEDAATVRAEILAGAPGLEEIGDRADAIRRAVADLRPGDLLVIAGKGHEHGQIIGTEVRPFDDTAEAKAAVAEVGA